MEYGKFLKSFMRAFGVAKRKNLDDEDLRDAVSALFGDMLSSGRLAFVTHARSTDSSKGHIKVVLRFDGKKYKFKSFSAAARFVIEKVITEVERKRQHEQPARKAGETGKNDAEIAAEIARLSARLEEPMGSSEAFAISVQIEELKRAAEKASDGEIPMGSYYTIVKTNLGRATSYNRKATYNYPDEVLVDDGETITMKYYGQKKRRHDPFLQPGALLFSQQIANEYAKFVGVITSVEVTRVPDVGPIAYTIVVRKVVLEVDEELQNSAPRGSGSCRFIKGGVAGALGVPVSSLKGNYMQGIVGPSVDKQLVPDVKRGLIDA
jgi:hypothetical protein